MPSPQRADAVFELCTSFMALSRGSDVDPAAELAQNESDHETKRGQPISFGDAIQLCVPSPPSTAHAFRGRQTTPTPRRPQQSNRILCGSPLMEA